MKLYANAEAVWVQEEPKNMGAWTFVQPRFATRIFILISPIHTNTYILIHIYIYSH
jgi:hypothetical protein